MGQRTVEAATEAGTAVVAISAAASERDAIIGDRIGIHRHGRIQRDRPAAQDVRGGVQRDALLREDIAGELRTGAERGTAADLPVDAGIRAAIEYAKAL